jgi:acetate kinase
MAVLVLNAGSATLKYRLFRDGRPVDGGLVEHQEDADRSAAVRTVLDRLGVGAADLTAVGHRVVHGGPRFREPVLLDDVVVAAIRDLVPLAPLHNPAGLAGIDAARALLPGIPQVAVFDTAFHATLPAAAAAYAIDRDLADRYDIRRYGFHGISHRYVSRATADLLRRPVTELNTIVLHLGNGASACAVAGGRSVETSMGLTPLEGLVMGTRVGDIDPAVAFHLIRVAGLDPAAVEDLYQHRSGLLGLCGTNDVRDIQTRLTDPAARHALDVYCHRIRKYVGAYHAVLGRLDAIAFTAGVGEHSAVVRAGSLAALEPLGIAIDPALNESGDGPRVISPPGSRVAVCVVPTDEEAGIAEETLSLLSRPTT